MTHGISGSGDDEECGEKQSADQQQNVNERSLLILQLIQRLATSYPNSANVTEFVTKLHAEDDKSWNWLSDLGLIRGTPELAFLTADGRKVLDTAVANATFRATLEAADSTPYATDQHAAAVLALLYANYEQRYAVSSKSKPD